MNPVRKQRMVVLLFILCGAGAALSLALMALQENVNLYYSPSRMVNGEAPVQHTIRGGGLVVQGSLQRASGSLDVTFDITDGGETVTVHYNGLLPDLFREGQGIVAVGQLDDNSTCLLYTSPSPRDRQKSRMPSSA